MLFTTICNSKLPSRLPLSKRRSAVMLGFHCSPLRQGTRLIRRSCFKNKDRIFSRFSYEFLPTDDDILNTYIATSGITTTYLGFDQVCYSVVDVGGASSERKKWRHVLGEVPYVVFVVPLSAYDSKAAVNHAMVCFNSSTSSNAAKTNPSR